MGLSKIFSQKKLKFEEILHRWQKEPKEEISSGRPLVSRSLHVREPCQVARRALVVSAITHLGFGGSHSRIVDWLHRKDLWDEITPWEKELLDSKEVDLDSMTKAKWYLERLWMLAWSLKLVEVMDHTLPCGPQLKDRVPGLKEDIRNFVSDAKLRSAKELSSQRDRLALYRQLLQSGGKIPGRLNPGVIFERFQAIEWVVNKTEAVF